MGFGKDGKGAILREDTTITLAALAADDVVIGSSSLSLDGDFRILKSEIIATARGLTGGEGAALVLSMANGDLTAAQIEATIEQNGPQAQNDRDRQEIAERWVRRVGVTVEHSSTVVSPRMFRNEQNGALLELKPRWTFIRRRTAADGGWSWAVYNNGVTLTTGATVHLLATHYGVWVN